MKLSLKVKAAAQAIARTFTGRGVLLVVTGPLGDRAVNLSMASNLSSHETLREIVTKLAERLETAAVEPVAPASDDA